jgi:hypothetical protein
VTSRILIIHTPLQLEEASSLVDLLEASLSLVEGAIVCSSLPGYAPRSRAGIGMNGKEFSALLDELGAALVLCDESALCDAQLWFDAAAVWSRGKRLAVVVDSAGRAAQLPSQLANAPAIVRSERSAIIGLIEDLAFDMRLSPRLGRDAQHALDQLSTLPPPLPASERPTFRKHPPGTEAVSSDHAIEIVPPSPPLPEEAREAREHDYDGDEPFELDDSDVEPVPIDPEPLHSQIEPRLRCQSSLDAGRAIGECSFHRDGGGDLAAELEGPFGAFVDAAGGNWDELKRLGDVEVWLAATDNLLQGLPAARRDACEWYEIGFQFSTLRSIAEQGMPKEPEQRAIYQDMWNQSMAQLRTSAVSAGIAPREVRRLQGLLENLIGPEPQRDYANISRALTELRDCAAAADGDEPQMSGRAAG